MSCERTQQFFKVELRGLRRRLAHLQLPSLAARPAELSTSKATTFGHQRQDRRPSGLAEGNADGSPPARYVRGFVGGCLTGTRTGTRRVRSRQPNWFRVPELLQIRPEHAHTYTDQCSGFPMRRAVSRPSFSLAHPRWQSVISLVPYLAHPKTPHPPANPGPVFIQGRKIQ